MSDFSPEQLSAIEKIKKALNLAAKAGTPEEAATAAATAQRLLAQYNLDSAAIENSDAGKREQLKLEGGRYAFQRELWAAVAELNFCIYWNQPYMLERFEGAAKVKDRRHALVGKTVNVRSTIVMAQYLEAAIERVLGERLPDEEQKHSNWGWSFRKGAAYSISMKLYDRRAELKREEAREIKKRMAEAAAQGAASSGTALTISTLEQTEHDANQDFLYGEGYSAKVAARRVAEAKRRKAMEAAYTAWAAANPKEAQSKFKFVDEEGVTWSYGRASSGRARSGGSGASENIDYGAYKAGREAGEKIGLDPQAGTKKKAERITGPKVMHL